ncbi:MAG: aminotransferase class I/II-fold pyridoxal phosphate-dependent enzyme, partial [Solirubrobacteraceae bacterium]
ELLRERPHRVQRLRANARALRRALAVEGFPVQDSDMHIVPLIVGDERTAMRLCQEAIAHGAFAQAIRSPTVAMGTARLRLTTMASHTTSELQLAAGVFGRLAREIGLEPAMTTPSLPERELVVEDLQEDFQAQAYVEERGLVAFSSERGSDAQARARGPFDLERGSAAHARAQASGPFDLEDDRQTVGEPTEPMETIPGPGVPFDFERETSGARAA